MPRFLPGCELPRARQRPCPSSIASRIRGQERNRSWPPALLNCTHAKERSEPAREAARPAATARCNPRPPFPSIQSEAKAAASYFASGMKIDSAYHLIGCQAGTGRSRNESFQSGKSACGAREWRVILRFLRGPGAGKEGKVLADSAVSSVVEHYLDTVAKYSGVCSKSCAH